MKKLILPLILVLVLFTSCGENKRTRSLAGKSISSITVSEVETLLAGSISKVWTIDKAETVMASGAVSTLYSENMQPCNADDTLVFNRNYNGSINANSLCGTEGTTEASNSGQWEVRRINELTYIVLKNGSEETFLQLLEISNEQLKVVLFPKDAGIAHVIQTYHSVF